MVKLVPTSALADRLQPLGGVLNPMARRFDEAGHRLFLVGGVVRDLLLGDDAYDLDLTTDARPGAIKALVGPGADALWAQGERFGTIGVRLGDWDLEITTHRAEAYDPESRKPEVRFGTDLHEDLSRRDFTINAMAIVLPFDGGVSASDRDVEVVDPFEGLADLEARVLRTPLSPEVSFTDDPLRVLRAARFAARFALTPVPELEAAAADLADRLAIVATERIATELDRLLDLDDPSVGLAFLDRTGVLDHVLPAYGEVDAADRRWALNVAGQPVEPERRLLIRRAALLHPLRPTGADRALRRLRVSNADRSATVALVDATTDRPATEAGVRRAVARTAAGGSDPATFRSMAATLGQADVVAAFDHLAATEDLDDLGPPVTGAEIMAALDLAPGPVIGRAQRHLTDHRLDHGPLSGAEAIELLRAWLADQERAGS